MFCFKAEIPQNPLAIKFQIDAVKYLITEDKKVGKFEKFGFYCKTCDAYMTGQIQLIMVYFYFRSYMKFIYNFFNLNLKSMSEELSINIIILMKYPVTKTIVNICHMN